MRCDGCGRNVRTRWVRLASAVTMTVNYQTGRRRTFLAGHVLCSDICFRSLIHSGEDLNGQRPKWDGQTWRVGEKELFQRGGIAEKGEG